MYPWKNDKFQSLILVSCEISDFTKLNSYIYHEKTNKLKKQTNEVL